MPPTDRHPVCLTVVSEPIIGVIDDDDQHVGSRSVDGQLSGLRRKMGQTDIRRLLTVGAMSVIRWAVRKGGSANRWLATLVTRNPKMVAAVALANRMARMIWAVTTKQEDYRMA